MIAAFSISPLGGDESVGAVVADCVRIVRDSGLPNETNAMFTNIEGEWDQVMAVIKACMDHVNSVAPRATLVIKVDALAADPGGRMRSKVESVERHLGG
ncbi:MAG TPA: MTH1187 family thiamine-binding protein [Acidimicrobiales bacterium]|nr:MTH1187 family thiamine-binding protein [Acidimicrobiales bacterium]